MAARPFPCQGGLRPRRAAVYARLMTKDQERERRLAEALRANLRRRKEQRRAAGPSPERPTEQPEEQPSEDDADRRHS